MYLRDFMLRDFQRSDDRGRKDSHLLQSAIFILPVSYTTEKEYLGGCNLAL